MSGGVDSAVAAALLHQQGYEVIGVTMRLYTESDPAALRSKRTCCGIEDVADARATAQRIGIPHYILNLEREFATDVIDRFAAEYAAGRTPNPCLSCNQHVKFATLLDRAVAMGCDLLATGHYARIERDEAGYHLLAAADEAKDQSYVLFTLGQHALARTCFPLGAMTKAETRRIAASLGLPVAEKPDSADICFVPGGDYRALLRERGVRFEPGPIRDAQGTTIGTHDGAASYTVGQRRGIPGVTGAAVAAGAAGERRYVTAIDAETNIITLGREDELFARRIEASDPHWVLGPPAVGEPLTARIRYHATPAPARVTAYGPGGFVVECDRRVRAATPGQALVLYRGDEVVGGGTIERATNE